MMNLQHRYHTCILKIELPLEQFRCDDKPLILVSMCPTHSVIGGLSKLYLSTDTDIVLDQKPSLVALEEDTV